METLRSYVDANAMRALGETCVKEVRDDEGRAVFDAHVDGGVSAVGAVDTGAPG